MAPGPSRRETHPKRKTPRNSEGPPIASQVKAKESDGRQAERRSISPPTQETQGQASKPVGARVSGALRVQYYSLDKRRLERTSLLRPGSLKLVDKRRCSRSVEDRQSGRYREDGEYVSRIGFWDFVGHVLGSLFCSSRRSVDEHTRSTSRPHRYLTNRTAQARYRERFGSHLQIPGVFRDTRSGAIDADSSPVSGAIGRSARSPRRNESETVGQPSRKGKEVSNAHVRIDSLTQDLGLPKEDSERTLPVSDHTSEPKSGQLDIASREEQLQIRKRLLRNEERQLEQDRLLEAKRSSEKRKSLREKSQQEARLARADRREQYLKQRQEAAESAEMTKLDRRRSKYARYATLFV